MTVNPLTQRQIDLVFFNVTVATVLTKHFNQSSQHNLTYIPPLTSNKNFRMK